MNAIAKSAPVAPAKVAATPDTKTQKPMVDAPVTEFTGIKEKNKPITAKQIHDFVKQHAGNQPANVDVVVLESVNVKAEKPFPFTQMNKAGKRSNIMWALVQGVGKDHDRRLSAIKDYGVKNGMSGEKLDDILAALNGGYSAKSKQWGTSFIKLVVRKG